VREALRVVEACGLPAVVSSAVETSVGLAAGVALAAALPSLPYACGLGTMSLLSGDVVEESLVPVGGRLPVRRPSVNFQHLSAFEVESPQWLRRMQEASL
jgi:O-succinylbenzoate synthase